MKKKSFHYLILILQNTLTIVYQLISRTAIYTIQKLLWLKLYRPIKRTTLQKQILCV